MANNGKVNVENICDKCFKQVEVGEKLMGFEIFDSLGNTKQFKGHEECVNEIRLILEELYGDTGEDEGYDKNE